MKTELAQAAFNEYKTECYQRLAQAIFNDYKNGKDNEMYLNTNSIEWQIVDNEISIGYFDDDNIDNAMSCFASTLEEIETFVNKIDFEAVTQYQSRLYAIEGIE